MVNQEIKPFQDTGIHVQLPRFLKIDQYIEHIFSILSGSKRNSPNLVVNLSMESIPWDKYLHPGMVTQGFVVATSPVSLNPEEMSGGNLPCGDLSLLSPPSSTAFREPSLLVATGISLCHYALH